LPQDNSSSGKLSMTTDNADKKIIPTNKRFDGYLAVVIDVETGGVDPKKCALLELAAIVIHCDENGLLVQQEKYYTTHVTPFEGAVIEEKALEINGIVPDHPFRLAINEQTALEKLDAFTHEALKLHQCRRAVLVGHNAHFDLSFLNAARERCGAMKNNPYHRFTCFDTATLAGAALQKTVLAKALKAAGIKQDKKKAHSALYDTQCTAELFCQICNRLGPD
jgi:ribonuclease T